MKIIVFIASKSGLSVYRKNGLHVALRRNLFALPFHDKNLTNFKWYKLTSCSSDLFVLVFRNPKNISKKFNPTPSLCLSHKMQCWSDFVSCHKKWNRIKINSAPQFIASLQKNVMRHYGAEEMRNKGLLVAMLLINLGLEWSIRTIYIGCRDESVDIPWGQYAVVSVQRPECI